MGIAALALAMSGCGELLDIDTIEPMGPGGTGATGSGGAGGGGAGGGGAASGGGGGALPQTVVGRGCVAADVCGPDGASCCESRLVEGEGLGEYPMGCSWVPGRPCDTSSQGPQHPASVGDFYLDTFEGTVGRFRQFEEEYATWRAAGNPAVGAGAHPRILDSGWKEAWSEQLPGQQGSFTYPLDINCQGDGWLSWQGNSDPALAQNCVSWVMGFAFCVWTGGRLPTEAEWEIAATGAAENRLYAWGNTKPAPDLAVYNVDEVYPPDAFYLELAGSRPLGVARFGHHDMSGSVTEWALDQYSETWFTVGGDGNPCNDCANLGDVSDAHTVRGGAWSQPSSDLMATERLDVTGINSVEYTGVRCARDGAPP
jgi:formylglycine-generating enzyme required for sulfatase activity